MPDITAKGFGTGTLKLSRINDNTNIIGKLRELDSRPTIEITGAIVYTDGQVDGVESIFDSKCYLTNPSWGDDSDITWSVKIDEGLDINMPCDVMNEITCAGVV